MKQYERIGFTCSAFDLLHAGHMLMLKDAKSQCDRLVVGLQEDPNLDRKEKNKPNQTLEERFIMLSGCKYIDEIWTYRTEAELYNHLKETSYDLRILGSDWLGKDYTGIDLKIPVYWHNRNHDWSTTNLRKRIRNHHRKV